MPSHSLPLSINPLVLQKLWPHYLCGRSKDGTLMYWERPAGIEMDQIHARGINQAAIVRHWLFFAEYQWNTICSDNPNAKCVSIMDMEGVGMGMVFGESIGLIKNIMTICNHHYPERSHMIFIIK